MSVTVMAITVREHANKCTWGNMAPDDEACISQERGMCNNCHMIDAIESCRWCQLVMWCDQSIDGIDVETTDKSKNDIGAQQKKQTAKQRNANW